MIATTDRTASAATTRALASSAVVRVAAAVTLSRLAVAMTPLALVFLARGRPGGYAFGAVLAGVYAVAEAGGALLLGPRLDRGRIRRDVALGMGGSGLAFAALGAGGAAPVTVALVALAGFAAAGAPGGLRTLLGRAVPESAVRAAFGLETTLTQAVWAVAPALVGTLALGLSARAPFLVAAVAMLGAAASVATVPGGGAASAVPRGRPGTLWNAWPIYLTSAGAMFLLATVELVLPALLEYRHVPVAWAGPLLAVFSVASIGGAVVYGARRWPGTPRTHSIVLLFAVGLLALGLTRCTTPAAVGVLLGVAGVAQAALLTARNLSLRARLPEHAHAGGYSLLYAGSAVGYAVSGAVSGLILSAGGPLPAVCAGGAAVLLIGVVSAAVEIRA